MKKCLLGLLIISLMLAGCGDKSYHNKELRISKHNGRVSGAEITKSDDIIITGNLSLSNTESKGRKNIIKTDNTGKVKFEKGIELENKDFRLIDIKATDDEGCIIAGKIRTNSSMIRSYYDSLIIKLDKNGEEEWRKNFKSKDEKSVNQEIEAINVTNDGGYILLVTSSSNNGDIICEEDEKYRYETYGGTLVKINKTGDIEWQKCINVDEKGLFESIGIAEDGGFWLVGDVKLVFSKKRSKENEFDSIIAKTDKNGNLLWYKISGGNLNDRFFNVISTEDGGAVVDCSRDSVYTIGNKTELIKYSKNGDVEWKKDRKDEAIIGLEKTSDGVISYGSKIAKFDKNGQLQWERQINDDEFIIKSIEAIDKDNFVLIGTTDSKDSDSDKKDIVIMSITKDSEIFKK